MANEFTPITRLEHIIAGDSLTPLNREEAIYAGVEITPKTRAEIALQELVAAAKEEDPVDPDEDEKDEAL